MILEKRIKDWFPAHAYHNGVRIEVRKFCNEILIAEAEKAQVLVDALFWIDAYTQDELIKKYIEVKLASYRGEKNVAPVHNVSIGEHIIYCKECGFPIEECNCLFEKKEAGNE